MEAASNPKVTVVGVSALNTHPRRSQFKLVVIGAPITQACADEVAADIYTGDAASAGQTAKAHAE